MRESSIERHIYRLSASLAAVMLALTVGISLISTPAEAAIASAQPLVGIVSTPSGHGYWQAAADGGVFAFGDAHFYGSMGGQHLNSPIVGMAATPSGGGYWLVAADGGVFAFGNAGFYGSMGGKPLNKPIVGMAATPSGGGYWLVAADGGVFAFGNAGFYGSMGGKPLSGAVDTMVQMPTGDGYWLAATDGGVFAFGAATYYGRATYTPPQSPAGTYAFILPRGSVNPSWLSARITTTLLSIYQFRQTRVITP
jgi:hypothetical protein